MVKSIEKRALKGTIWGGLNFAMIFFQNIVLVPIFLKYWGTENYGLWLAVYAAYGMLQRLDFGHQLFISYELNKLWVDDKKKFRAYLGSSLTVANLMGLFEIILVILLWKFGLLGTLFGLDETELLSKKLHLALLVIMTEWLLIGSVAGIIVKLFGTFGDYDIGQRVGFIFKLVTASVLTIAAFNGLSVFLTSIILTTLIILIGLITLIYFKFKYPNIFPWWKSASFKIGFSNLAKSTVLIFSGLVEQFNITGITLVISSNLGPGVIPAYTTLRAITSTIKQTTGLVLNPILPDMARFYVENKFDKLTQVLRANLFVTGLPANLIIFILMPFVQWIYQKWTGGVLQFNMPLFYILALSALITNFGSGMTSLINAINDTKLVLIVAISKLSAAAFIFATIKILGLLSIGIGILISDLISTVVIPIIVLTTIYKKNGHKFDFLGIIVGVIPILFIGVSFIAHIYFYNAIFYIVYILTWLINIYYFYRQWLILDIQVKQRLLSLFSKFIPNKTKR